MCGICGKVSVGGVALEDLRLMTGAIVHRGPDDDGFYCDGQVGLGMRRLSIIDLQGGGQPICNEDHSMWIVFNGEVYNYKLLRADLIEKGHQFKTNSDTEVIIHLYEEYGVRCLDKLNGMFAFAIWDEREQQLFLARDRLGQKPLFYYQSGKTFCFASEIKAILAGVELEREIDYESVHHYLSLRFIPSPRTMLSEISKLPPAHYLIYKDGFTQVSRYWDLSFQNKLDLSEDEFIDCLGEKLKEAVALHLVSDVPVGAFLSGGMDSSIIVAMISNATSEKFMTFSIGVKEQDFNELPYARQVAQRYDTCHIENCVETNLFRLLPRMVWQMDEPSDPIAACMYHAAELASRHVKVVLGGDGGDELFAGFDRYLGVGYINHYTLIPSLFRQRLIGPLLDVSHDSFTYKSLTQKLRWMHQLSLLPQASERFAEATMFFRFSHRDKQSLFSQTFWQKVGHLNSANVIVQQYEKANADDPIDRMLYADYMTRLPEHSLMLTDRMTMAHSLESRSPLLDHTLVELLASFPSHLKIRKRELKYILRRLASSYLPEQIVRRHKQGFMLPIAYWLKTDLYDLVKQTLLDSFFIREGLFRRESVVKLIEDHVNNKVDNHVRLWMLLNLEIWHWLYIERCELMQVEERISLARFPGHAK